jgi:hypothetical protein
MLGVVKSVEARYVELGAVTQASANLTKGQDVDNCVPFITKLSVHARYQPDEWMTDVYFGTSPARVIVERTNTGTTLGMIVYVVEFDPNKVRVQQKSFNIPDSGSIPQTVNVSLDNTIVTSKSANQTHYRMSSGTATEGRYWALKSTLSSTQITFERYSSGGTTLAGHYYIFESLDGAFTTQAFLMDMGTGSTYDDQTISTIDMNKSWITPCSLYSNRNHAEAASQFMRVKFKNSSAVECDRQSHRNSYIQVRGHVVTHHDDTNVYHGQFDFTTDTGHTDVLPAAVDDDYAAAIATFRDGMIRPDVYEGTDYRRVMGRMNLVSPDYDDIVAYRQDGGVAGDLRWQVVQFAPAPGYYFGGYVTEQPTPSDPVTPVVTTVRCYRRDTGEFMGEATSSGTGGYYYLETTYSGEHYVVALDPAGGESYNILGYDLMVPTTISGG